MKEIVIDISDDGEIRLETRGFKGKACIEEAGFLKDLLGHETSRQLVPAYYEYQKKPVRRYLPLCG
jgi:hypothetical protein